MEAQKFTVGVAVAVLLVLQRHGVTYGFLFDINYRLEEPIYWNFLEPTAGRDF